VHHQHNTIVDRPLCYFHHTTVS
jgi:hypothetical protein